MVSPEHFISFFLSFVCNFLTLSVSNLHLRSLLCFPPAYLTIMTKSPASISSHLRLAPPNALLVFLCLSFDAVRSPSYTLLSSFTYTS